MQDIASLLELTGKTIQSIGKQPANDPTTTSDQQTQAFQENMERFLTTLTSVDVRLKRQIFGLEEAGILTLDKAKPKDDDLSVGQRPALEPNGLGMVGSLDVGWLKSRSNKVEREMEAELWAKARDHLEGVAGGTKNGGAPGDVNMSE